MSEKKAERRVEKPMDEAHRRTETPKPGKKAALGKGPAQPTSTTRPKQKKPGS